MVRHPDREILPVFHKDLKKATHEFVMFVYDITEHFPRSELYGATSQLRRAAVSIMLNNVEGFARKKPKVQLNFYEIAYGSAKESKYLIFLAHERKWITRDQFDRAFRLADRISGMLWSTIDGLERKIND